MIQIDDRESDSFKSICSIFFNEYEIKRLEVGDIVYNEIVYEHKTPDDFISSIKDGRLFSKIKKMNMNYERSYIVVSGSLTDLIDVGINYNSIIGAIGSCFVRGSPVVFCDNYENLCGIVKNLSEKLTDGKDRAITEIKLPIKDDPLRLICSLPGISKKKGQALLDEFGSPMVIFTASEKELMKVNGIGKKITDNIFTFDSMMHFGMELQSICFFFIISNSSNFYGISRTSNFEPIRHFDN